jgi:hypothetical protein
MNPSKAWNTKLEVGIFLDIKKPAQAASVRSYSVLETETETGLKTRENS